MGAALLLRIADPGHKRRSVSHNRRNGSEDVASVVLSFRFASKNDYQTIPTSSACSPPRTSKRRNPANPSRRQPVQGLLRTRRDTPGTSVRKARVLPTAGRRDAGGDDLAARLRHPHQRPVGAPCFETFRSRVIPTPNRIDPFIRAGLDLAQEVLCVVCSRF